MTEKLVLQHQSAWWKEGVVYQIYPASFKDSNDDGVGDIPGIISKLDYLQDLGVDIIWISPHYKSPQVDMGYDISDFEDIHEPYGTLQDCDRLVEEIHARGMKVIFDLVINHTSDQHPWFLESRSSKANPKRDWYMWRPAKYDEHGNRVRPNNWRSQFTNPAWTWDEIAQEYYLHLYAEGQPDLNWENEDCRRAIYDSAILFWLDRGVDGFRIDTVNRYSKTPGLPDAPVTEPGKETQNAVFHCTNGPRIHEYLQEMKEVMAKYDVMTVGELPGTPEQEDVLKYISPSSGELQMVFNFDTVHLGRDPRNRYLPVPFNNTEFKLHLTKWQTLPETTGSWTTVFLENHDQARSVSRFASDLPEFREIAAKMLATVLGTMTGTLFLYQGQEIGMINAPESWPLEEYKCVASVNYLNDVRKRMSNDPTVMEQAKKNLHLFARDHPRVPMQWDDTPNAGFCSGSTHPWMSVLENHREINVSEQLGRQDSVLEFWRNILKLRKRHSALFVYGAFTLVEQHCDLMMFLKTDSRTGERTLTVANLSQVKLKFEEIPEFPLSGAEILIQNSPSELGNPHQRMSLEPFEARVYLRRE